ncbi:hypothetical protein [Streptomyces sp. AHA2]|uniref:hypothetical protein n=1 Tax=Streptomyces sp. AHA2 TaxID=3064526 RepID=UPI002FE1F05B
MHGQRDIFEGTFIRVQSASFGLALEVQLRKRRRFGSRVLEETFVYPAEYRTAADAISEGKRRVREQHRASEIARARYRAALELTGDSE